MALSRPLAHPPPWLAAPLCAVCQLAGLGVGMFLRGAGAPPAAYLAGHALGSLAMARFLGLSPPWQALNVLLPFGAALYEFVPGWIPAAAAGFLAVIYLPTFWTGVPFYPTSREMYDLVAEQLPADRPFRFIDLGCGYGSLLWRLSRLRPAGKFAGVEIGLLPFLTARLRAAFSRGRIEVRMRNLWQVDLGPYDRVYAFLAPPPMARLWEKARAEMKPGALLLINSFPAPARAQAVKQARDRRGSRLYIHRI